MFRDINEQLYLQAYVLMSETNMSFEEFLLLDTFSRDILYAIAELAMKKKNRV